MKTYRSYTELAASQGDFIPMHGETRPDPVPVQTTTATAEQGDAPAPTEPGKSYHDKASPTGC
jgi:hypothetical protein